MRGAPASSRLQLQKQASQKCNGDNASPSRTHGSRKNAQHNIGARRGGGPGSARSTHINVGIHPKQSVAHVLAPQTLQRGEQHVAPEPVVCSGVLGTDIAPAVLKVASASNVSRCPVTSIPYRIASYGSAKESVQPRDSGTGQRPGTENRRHTTHDRLSHAPGREFSQSDKRAAV
jgi:hypothetical protein